MISAFFRFRISNLLANPKLMPFPFSREFHQLIKETFSSTFEHIEKLMTRKTSSKHTLDSNHKQKTQTIKNNSNLKTKLQKQKQLLSVSKLFKFYKNSGCRKFCSR